MRARVEAGETHAGNRGHTERIGDRPTGREAIEREAHLAVGQRGSADRQRRGQRSGAAVGTTGGRGDQLRDCPESDSENRASSRRAAGLRRAVEILVRRLDQPGVRRGAVAVGERVQRRKHARRIHPVDRPVAAWSTASGRAIEEPVGCLNQPGERIGAVSTRECMERRQRPRCVKSKDVSRKARPTVIGRPVERFVARLD